VGLWVRVVSMPCTDLYEQQPRDYKLSVFPRGAPVMSIEASGVDCWRRFAHAPFGIVNSFGLSAPADKIYEHFGFGVANLTERASDVIAFYTAPGSNGHPVAPSLLDMPVFPTIAPLHHA
jgi:transketolase